MGFGQGVSFDTPIVRHMLTLKSIKARLLFKEFPQLKKKLWGGDLWNPSYFVATASEHTETQIRQYIQNQKVR
ncbi:transposase [Aneurinibacillus thermoaerophilus]|uniref:transposase n=1 Tax=Aneurinibacillus TaxID=55079 RepID=UPI000B2D538A|nr:MULTISPECIES: transposase [Aneurinibacillus]MED0676809.1 transposase [Aneurinibacillus thermoaerophilus]MED0757606.1 transposase [Aneurinibacillus thermoaerophilus]MED0759245.1 transposase [Aneurinibacillus thermoaerophilus]